jgi:hypothetical protein
MVVREAELERKQPGDEGAAAVDSYGDPYVA